MILRNGKRIDGTSIDTLPIGTLSPFLGLTAPEGYLLCQGQKVSKTRYKQLYEICGDLFGTSTDTEFYLPDLRGKTLVGYNSNNSSMNTIGKLLGSESHTHTTGNHTLTVDEMPSHTHGVAFDQSEYSGIEWLKTGGNSGGPYWNIGSYVIENGGSQAHNHGDTGSASNYQPSFITNWIVKAERVSYTSATVYNGLDSDSETNALSAKQGKVLNAKFDNYTKTSNLATVATSGSYSDLSNKPTIPSVVNNLTSTSTASALSAAQGKKLNEKTDPHFTEIYSTTIKSASLLTQGYNSSNYMPATLRNKIGTGNDMYEYYGGIMIPNIEKYSVLIVELNCGGHTSGSSSQFAGGICLYDYASAQWDSEYGDDWQNNILPPITDNYWKGVMTKIIYVGERTGSYVVGSVWKTYRGDDFEWNSGFGERGSTMRVVGFLR